jgi:DNA invertase Pin-like site-specific DNA recombinase
MAVIGYARVSTSGQDYNGQITELKAVGCERIYREKVSGAQSDRVELRKLLKAIRRGDVLIVTRLDRLARSTLDLLSILRRVTEASAKFQVVERPLGRYDDTAWRIDGHDPGRLGDIRKTSDQSPHG